MLYCMHSTVVTAWATLLPTQTHHVTGVEFFKHHTWLHSADLDTWIREDPCLLDIQLHMTECDSSPSLSGDAQSCKRLHVLCCEIVCHVIAPTILEFCAVWQWCSFHFDFVHPVLYCAWLSHGIGTETYRGLYGCTFDEMSSIAF